MCDRSSDPSQHDQEDPVTAEPDTLDAAWREAEAALPDGWFIGLLVWAFPSAVASPEVAWTASAADYSVDDGLDASGTGPTPTAALLALAARLTETARSSSEGTTDPDGTYHPTAEDYAMGNMAAGHEHWDDR